VQQLGLEEISRREKLLFKRLLTGLGRMNGVVVHGPRDPERRCGVVSFTVAGTDASQVGFLLDRNHDISVRVGLHCAPLAHKTIGTFPEGTVRVSPGCFNTEDDIDQFLAALQVVIS
jgi:cysteine desulfurase / selenocysteine lyase